MRTSRDLKLVELSREQFPLTWRVLQEGLSEQVAPGMVAGLWQASDPSRIQVAAIGERRILPSPQPMLPETIFDLASVTKIFATASLAAVLVERGWIRWDQPLKSLLPDYSQKEIRLDHLLSHTSGLPDWAPLWEKMRQHFGTDDLYGISISDRQTQMRKLASEVKPVARPSERTNYSDIGFMLLGFALEEATKMPLDQAVATLVWEPMGLQGAFFRRIQKKAGDDLMESAAATEQCPWRKAILQGQVHDDNCWSMGGYAAHAGAFAGVRDVLHFAASLMRVRFLTRDTLRTMWTRVLRPAGCERTLGWDTPSNEGSSAGRFFPPLGTVGHLGFTGTSLWMDLEARIAVTLLSNRVHPTRENAKFKPYRARFHEALRKDLNPRLPA